MIVKKIKADNIKDAVKIIASSGCDDYVYENLQKKLSVILLLLKI